MARYFLQSTRALVRVVRNNIEVFATLAAIVAGAVVPLPSPTHSDSPPSMRRSSQAHSNSGQVRRWSSTNSVAISIALALE